MPWTEPTDEQLANFATLRTFGLGYSPGDRDCVLDILTRSPMVKKLWLESHREFQARADGLATARAGDRCGCGQELDSNGEHGGGYGAFCC